MKKPILITLLCTCLMLVTPFTVVAHENKISSNLTDEPDIEGLVAQLRVVIDEILEKYGHIPMVRGLCNVIINILDLTIGRIIYCVALLVIRLPLAILFITFLNLDFYILWQTFGGLLLIAITEFDLECTPYLPNPFKSIYNMLETKDCPCLEE